MRPEYLLSLCVAFVVCALCYLPNADAQDPTKATWRDSLHFHAPFDGTPNAKLSSHGGKIYTATTLERKQSTPGITRDDVLIAKGEGKFGDCLRFTNKSPKVIYFAGDEMHYREVDWSGTVSFWMRLNPDQDLKPGYCDPIQITQHAWNDGCFFVDFDKDLPRDFRLGSFADLKKWNPTNIPWETLPVEKRPMVTVKEPPFTRESWTHIVFTFDGVNSQDKSPSTSKLYLNGALQGALVQPMSVSWELDQAAIMLGIEYIGDMDDLTIFTRALTETEVDELYHLTSPL